MKETNQYDQVNVASHLGISGISVRLELKCALWIVLSASALIVVFFFPGDL